MELRDPRLIHAQLGADLLHRHLAVVIERDHTLLAGRKGRERAAHALPDLALFVERIWPFRLSGHQHCRQLLLIHLFGGRVGRRGLDRVDADDGLAEPLLVGTDRSRQVGQRRLVAELGPQLLASGLQFAAHPPHPARPRILSQGVNHRPADAAFREGLELDAAAAVESLRRVNEPDHAVLDQVTEVNRVRHGCRHSPGKGLHEGQSGFHSVGCCAGIENHSFAHPPDPGLGPAPH